MDTESDLEVATVKAFRADRERLKTLGRRLKLLRRYASSQPTVISMALDALERDLDSGFGVGVVK